MVRDYYQTAKAFLQGRAFAYNQVFNPASVHTPIVLADLARFCRAHMSTAAADPIISARLDGRREVWLRIAMHLNLSSETLWLLFDGSPTPPTQRGNDQ